MASAMTGILPLEELEALFKARYTENDEVYMETLRKPLDPPPTVVNWYSRPKRIFDWASHDRGGQRGHGNRGHHQGNRNYNQGHRGYYQGNKGHYQRDRGHYQENRGHKQGNRGHYGGHRGGYHGDWHGRDKNRDNRQQQKHEHSNSDLGGRPSQQGPSRVFYPGMKDFEQAQIQSQARYHPYQRGDQTHTQGSHSQSTAQQGQNQGPT